MNYAKHHITQDDKDAVMRVLDSDHLTQGPVVEEFEEAFAAKVGKKYAVAFNSGTSALVAAFHCWHPSTVITTPLTFVATANAARAAGHDVEFVDINPTTLVMGVPNNNKTLWAPMEYAGHPATRS